MDRSDHADIVFAMTGDVRRNSRALRQLRALSGLGLRIHVLAMDQGPGPGFDVSNATLELIERPAASGPNYFWSIHHAVKKAAAAVEAAIYHASDLYVLPALTHASEKHGSQTVYDARELYPHVASTIGRPWVRYFWRFIERRFIARTDLVFTVSEGIADKLREMYDVPRPLVVHNVPDRVHPTIRRSLRVASELSGGQALILHQGQMRAHRGCDLLVDAMRDVSGAILVFLGDGPLQPDLERQAQAARISSRVRFAEPVPPDELLAYTASGDIGVSLLDDTCLNHRLALPNKLFECLTANLPVIASDLPEMRKVVRTYDVGMLVQPGNRADLVAALNQAVIDKTLRENWRRNIPRALETFNWNRASEHFLHAYQKLLAKV